MYKYNDAFTSVIVIESFNFNKKRTNIYDQILDRAPLPNLKYNKRPKKHQFFWHMCPSSQVTMFK